MTGTAPSAGPRAVLRHRRTFPLLVTLLLVPVVLGAPWVAAAEQQAGNGRTTTTAAPRDAAPASAPSTGSDAAPARPVQTSPEPTDPAPTPTVPSTTTPALEARATESQQATTRLNRIVVALLVLAAVIAGVTVFFWRRTRPERDGPGASPPRRGAVLVSADGHEEPLVDPGPAAGLRPPVGEDAWRVRPAPQLDDAATRTEVLRAGTASGAEPLARQQSSWWASQDPGSAAAEAESRPAGPSEPRGDAPQ